jgi:4-amino-4-deoxy-L-arabinose transferase-like glycosyltransferase
LEVSALPAKSDKLLSAYLTVALVWVVANMLTLAPSGLYGRLVGAVILFCVLPGALIVSRALALASADRKAPPWPEVLLLGSAVSYLVTTTIVLLLGYVPQPITYAALLGVCDVIILVVLYLNYRSRLQLWSRSPVSLDRSNAGTVALVLVVLLAAFVRLGNLGYGEYVGDEIDVVYRARQAILGNQEELFLQRKGPVQIMVTAAFALGTNSFDELPLRLPFALASVLSVATLYLLGASAWNRRVGLLAAAALAIDGVVVGFSRVVQYGGVVLLTLVVIVYCLHRMSTSEEAGLRRRYLSLALILLASALLAHYEAAMVAVPMAMLLFRERKRVFARENLKELTVAVVIVLALLVVFYVPFVLHPHFSETTDAYANVQMGFGEGPFNNVGRFVGTNIFYNSVYYMVLAALLWGLGTFAVLSRALPARWRAGAYVAVALVVAGTILSLIAPGSLASEGRSWALVCFVPALALAVWFASPKRIEQAMFAWFFTVFIVSTFLVKTQHLHFYTMAPSAALVAALGLDWVITKGRLPQLNAVRWVAWAAGVGVYAVLAGYLYLVFVQTSPQYAVDFPDHRSSLYWTPQTEFPPGGFFGFPDRKSVV